MFCSMQIIRTLNIILSLFLTSQNKKITEQYEEKKKSLLGTNLLRLLSSLESNYPHF